VDPQLTVEFQSYRDAYSDDFEDVRRRVPDLTKLRSTTRVDPLRSLDEIVRDVVAWKEAETARQSAHEK
jgi:UDP-glucose 4-epimerase